MICNCNTNNGNSSSANNSFRGSTTFTMVDYPLYHAGQIGGTRAEDGKVFNVNQILNQKATGLNYIPDGWYTKNTMPWMSQTDNGTDLWVIEATHFVDGVEVEWKDVTTNLS